MQGVLGAEAAKHYFNYQKNAEKLPRFDPSTPSWMYYKQWRTKNRATSDLLDAMAGKPMSEYDFVKARRAEIQVKPKRKKVKR